MKRCSAVMGAVGILLLTVAVASAQEGRGGRGGRGGEGGQGRGQQAPPPEPTNLKVLPKDMTRAQVVPVMQNIAAALGVQCIYCHAGQGPGADFASDEKPTKEAARQMILMVRDINMKVPAAVNKPREQATNVGCITCHRGVAIPKQLADILPATAADKGMPAALAQYDELKQKYYGAQAYDFTENGLITSAQRSIQNNKPDDAIAFLEKSAQMFPKAAQNYVIMAQAYQRKNDKANQIKSLEKAVELAPDNQGLKNQLNQLKQG
jgi:hypothetical protein